jgi:hypothetical protein
MNVLALISQRVRASNDYLIAIGFTADPAP